MHEMDWCKFKHQQNFLVD